MRWRLVLEEYGPELIYIDSFQSTETGCLTLNFIDYQNKPQLKSDETHILSSADGSTDGDPQQMAQQMANSFSAWIWDHSFSRFSPTLAIAKDTERYADSFTQRYPHFNQNHSFHSKLTIQILNNFKGYNTLLYEASRLATSTFC